MNTRKTRIAALVLAIGLSGTAQAALQGRDLDGNTATAEAYYDTVLNITWLADANYAATQYVQTGGLQGSNLGRMEWGQANTWAANLSFHDSVNNIAYDNWRLPAITPVNGTYINYDGSLDGTTDAGFNSASPSHELAYMYHVNLGNLGEVDPNGVERDCYVNSSDTCLKNVGPFVNVQADLYWYGSPEYEPISVYAWYFAMSWGGQFAFKENNFQYAWAVSPGDVGVAAVPETDTWAMLVAGLGVVGFIARRRKLAEANVR